MRDLERMRSRRRDSAVMMPCTLNISFLVESVSEHLVSTGLFGIHCSCLLCVSSVCGAVMRCVRAPWVRAHARPLAW